MTSYCGALLPWNLNDDHRGVASAPRAADRRLIGHYLTLLAAAQSAHMRYVMRHRGACYSLGSRTTSDRRTTSFALRLPSNIFVKLAGSTLLTGGTIFCVGCCSGSGTLLLSMYHYLDARHGHENEENSYGQQSESGLKEDCLFNNSLLVVVHQLNLVINEPK